MDPLTHFTTGALGGQALKGWFQGRAVVLFCIAAALLPDIDNVVGGGNPALYLIHHRGITHSLAGGAALALALSGVFRLFSRSFPFLVGAVVAYAATLSHIFLDLVTSYGTQVLLPFTNHRYTVECVFIIDPIFTGVLLVFLLSSLSARFRRKAAVLGLVFVVAYPLACLGTRLWLTRSLTDFFRSEGETFTAVHVSADALSPLWWKVIVEDASRYRMRSLWLPDPFGSCAVEDFERADMALVRRLGEKEPLFATWAWFAMYPVMKREAAADGGSRVTFWDLRFETATPFARKILGQNQVPFAITAMLDAGGNLTGYAWHRRGRQGAVQRMN